MKKIHKEIETRLENEKLDKLKRDEDERAASEAAHEAVIKEAESQKQEQTNGEVIDL